MRALAKLVYVNNPDKIFFVGEALVGNEAVDQLSKFDRALRDFSGVGASKGRGIDGMLVTKWDTVDDKAGVLQFAAHPTDADEGPRTVLQVGAALSLTYVTGQPIVFVGTGQVRPTYLVPLTEWELTK
jgi:signal recognition particle receptor subunit alpha